MGNRDVSKPDYDGVKTGLVSKQDVINLIGELNAISFYEANEHSKECYYEIRNAILAMPEQEPKWIPVSEPPKKLSTYLIQTDGKYMCECRWTDVNPYWTDKKTKPHWNIFDIPQYSKVVAWMPLPKPYKEESEEQS